MKTKSPFSKRFLQFTQHAQRYHHALNQYCKDLRGNNKQLYFLILKDLVYRFDNTKCGFCRSVIRKQGATWNADTYATLTERFNKLLKKPVSVKTVKRYHKDLADAGMLVTSRHFFAGKNTLHRRPNLPNLETALLSINYDPAVDSAPPKLPTIADKIDKILTKPGGDSTGDQAQVINITYTEVSEVNDFMEQTIEAGNELFGLGNLGATRKKVTQQARARIKRLVQERILGPLFIICLREAADNGEFINDGIDFTNIKYWPDWLDLVYPEGDFTPDEGLAGSWFLCYESYKADWMSNDQYSRYKQCGLFMQNYQNVVEKASENRKAVKQDLDATVEEYERENGVLNES